MIPVDLRRHRPGIASTGNLTLPVFLDLSPGQEWPRAQVTLLRALAENQELAEGFESALLPLPPTATRLLLRAAQAGTVRADRHLASAVVSHLGRLDPAEFSGGGFTATTLYALPVHAPWSPSRWPPPRRTPPRSSRWASAAAPAWPNAAPASWTKS